MSCEPSEFRAAMRGLASGVSLVTTLDPEGKPHGMAATAVMSVSADPPRILVCVNKTASMHAPLVAFGCYAVSFLSAAQADLVRIFSSPDQRHLRFAGSGWSGLTTGAPVLDGAVAVLDCVVVEQIDAISHSMFIGEVVATRAVPEPVMPLVHCHGGLGAFATAA
jgi:flavin reductase